MANIDPASNELYDINNYAPMSGRVLGEDGRAYNLVDLLINISEGDKNGKFLKSVPTYADLPKPASDYAGTLYFVQANTGGLFSFFGAYKYPRGFYSPNANGEWELVPISVTLSDNAFTIANITDWAGFMEFTKDVNIKDAVLYDGVLYQNLTGDITDIPPNEDTVNWAVLIDIKGGVINSAKDLISQDGANALHKGSDNKLHVVSLTGSSEFEKNIDTFVEQGLFGSPYTIRAELKAGGVTERELSNELSHKINAKIGFIKTPVTFPPNSTTDIPLKGAHITLCAFNTFSLNSSYGGGGTVFFKAYMCAWNQNQIMELFGGGVTYPNFSVNIVGTFALRVVNNSPLTITGNIFELDTLQ